MSKRFFSIVVAFVMMAVIGGTIGMLSSRKEHAPPGEEWTRTFGGDKDDNGRSVQQTADGGYVIAGYTRSFGAGGLDFYIVKADSEGNMLWNRSFGGSEYDYSSSVLQTFYGGYIIAGTTMSFGSGESDFYLVKTDSKGNMLWNRTFGGSEYEYCKSVLQTFDGGYILVGGAGSSQYMGLYHVYLVKIGFRGNKMWSKYFGMGTNGLSVQQTKDWGYLIAGSTGRFSAGETDFYIVKTDSKGNPLWNRTFGGSDFELCESVRQTTDGGYIMAGYTQSFGAGESDYYLVKTDSKGNMLWNRTFGGSDFDYCHSVQQTADRGYIMVGERGGDVCLIKLLPEGEGKASECWRLMMSVMEKNRIHLLVIIFWLNAIILVAFMIFLYRLGDGLWARS